MSATTLMQAAEQTGYLPFFHGTSKSWSVPKGGERMTVQQAIAAARLGFTVEKRPAGIADDVHGFDAAEDSFFLTNKRTGKIVNPKTVTGRYEVVQHRDAFLWASDILDSGEAVIEIAGQVKGGRTGFIVCRIPTSEVRVGGIDTEFVQPYLVLLNQHGGKSVTGMVTPVRPPCNNAMPYALAKASNVFRVRHTVGAVRDKMTVASGREALGITVKYMAEFERTMNRLLKQKVSGPELDRLLAEFIPLPKKAATTKTLADGTVTKMKHRGVTVALEKREAIKEIYLGADNLNNIRGSAFGLLNAFSEYQQHVVEGRNSRGGVSEAKAQQARYENRFERILTTESLDHEVFAALTAR